jgi:hypothetical protein
VAAGASGLERRKEDDSGLRATRRAGDHHSRTRAGMNLAGDVNEDFVDMLTALTAHQVDFLVVGAYALAAHGFPRATGDIDIFVAPTIENAERVYRALLDFGARVSAHGVTAKDFESKGAVYQIGLPPRRIDLLTSISGVEYEEAAEHALHGHVGPCSIRFIGRAALIKNKLSTGRTKDRANVEQLASLHGQSD